MAELPSDLQQWMRFSPSKEKAIRILISKITGNCKGLDFIFEAQKSNLEPWDLKELCSARLDSYGIKMGGYPEWWFFSPPNRNRSGSRARATTSGFWKVTAKRKKITSDSELIGEKSFLVFRIGRGEGKKTNWKIHEYSTLPGQSPFVLCRLFYKHKESVKDPNFNYTGPAVSSPSILFSASEMQATSAPENFGKTISTTITPVDCDGNSFSAHAAENQLGELTATELQQGIYLSDLQEPLDCNLFSPLTSDMQFGISSSISNDLNYNGHCGMHSPQYGNELAKFGFVFPDSTSAYPMKDNGYNGYNATASEFQQGLYLSDLQEPLDCNSFSPLTSDMQFGISSSISNDLNYNGHCGMHSPQYGNELAKFGFVFPDSTSAYPMKDNGYNGYNATASEFQQGLHLSDLQEPLDCNSFSPLTSDMQFGISSSISNDHNYNGHCGMHSPQYGNELAKFGYVFPDLTSAYPMMDNGYNGYNATASEFQLGMDLSDLREPLNCNSSSPLTSDMHFRMSNSVSNDYNSHCGTYSQYYGKNELPKFGCELPDLSSDYLNEIFPSVLVCQTNLTKSCGGLDARANALCESTFEGFGEISKGKASAGLLNQDSHMVSMGGSSNQILGSDCTPKNY